MSEYIEQLMESPSAIADNSFDLNIKFSRSEIDKIQPHWVRARFDQLKDKMLILRKLAQEHGIDAVNDLDDVLPLLLGHTVYKSYQIVTGQLSQSSAISSHGDIDWSVKAS